ncbi:hypothetical protein M758_3G136800 [Ceratodon purpureus]|nr:hypothetical protein M758_3G136800 [Ceratodon purpureus]
MFEMLTRILSFWIFLVYLFQLLHVEEVPHSCFTVILMRLCTTSSRVGDL